MTKYGSNSVAFILLDGYNLVDYGLELEIDDEALTEDATTFGLTTTAHAAIGLTQSKLDITAFYDDANDASNEALVGMSGAPRVVCYTVEGNTAGKKCVGFAGAVQATYRRLASKAGLTKGAISLLGSGDREESRIIAALAARTTAGNTESASIDNAAASTSGGAAYLEVTALTLGGYDDLTVVLRDSADNITFANVTGGGFTAVTAAPAAERKALSGTIRRYAAIAWTWTGSGTGQTATFMVALHRN